MKKRKVETVGGKEFRLFGLLDISQISLILVNLIPLVGVLFFGWSIFSILVLYWLESFSIAIYTLIKILTWKREKNSRLTSAIYFCFLYFIWLTPFYLGFISILVLKSNHLEEYLSILSSTIKNLLIPFIIFIISHGISFYLNYIKKKEFLRIREENLLAVDAFKRFLIMVFIAIITSILYMVIKIENDRIIFSLFILLKIYYDLKFHNKEHNTPIFKKE